MSDAATTEPRAYHRPITITVEDSYPMPVVRVLPQETQQTLNLKGDRARGEKLIADIREQIDRDNFFAITIDGVA